MVMTLRRPERGASRVGCLFLLLSGSRGFFLRRGCRGAAASRQKCQNYNQ